MYLNRLVGFTTDREFALQRHPAPKVVIQLLRLYPQRIQDCNYALTMQSTGQTETHLGESWCPSHSTQVFWSMT